MAKNHKNVVKEYEVQGYVVADEFPAAKITVMVKTGAVPHYITIKGTKVIDGIKHKFM
jgi:hypothetical protein